MSLENANIQNEGNGEPYSVEKIESLNRPEATIVNQKLAINGVVDERYKFVDNISYQASNPDLLHFDAVNADAELNNSATHIVDINNPEKDLLTINQERNGYDSSKVFVNGAEWETLRNKDVYFGGFKVEFDPIGNKAVFRASKGSSANEESVVVNNKEWQTKFAGLSKATSEFGTAYAVGDRKLVIEDKEWSFQKFSEEEKNSYSLSQWGNSIDSVTAARVGKNGEVAAAVSTIRGEEKTPSNHIFIGDKQGARTEWKESLGFVKDIAIDEESGTVAVFGERNGQGKQMEILISDIPYLLEENPEKLSYFKFHEGSLIIEYKDAMGGKVAEKITLHEGSEELQVQRLNKENEKKAFNELRDLLAKEKMSPSEVVARLKLADQLESKIEENTSIGESVQKLELEKAELERKLETEKELHEQKLLDAQRSAEQIKATLAQIAGMIDGMESVTFGTGYKMSKENRNNILGIISRSNK